MKNIILLFLIATNFCTSQILTQDFEGTTFPPNGWTISNTNPLRQWVPTTTLSSLDQTKFLISGTKSAAIMWHEQNNVAILTSPVFSLVNYTSATLTFKVKLSYTFMVSIPNGNFIAEISTNGSNWTQLWVEEEQGNFTDYTTLNITENLTAYLGQSNIQIRFRYNATDADTVSIDDIAVNGTLNNNEYYSNTFSVFPNPSNDIIVIKSNFNELLNFVEIYDINGRLVTKHKLIENHETELNIQELENGIYFAKIHSNLSSQTVKILKK